MSTGTSQRDNTRNQSTLDITQGHIFMGDNGYQEAVFLNNTGADLALQPASLVLRNAADASQVTPAISGATLVDVIGVVALENEFDVLDGATANINYCTTGRIDETRISLPAGVTLDTVVGTKTVRDILNAIGLELVATIDNTKHDN